jgi:hypothetical protein
VSLARSTPGVALPEAPSSRRWLVPLLMAILGACAITLYLLLKL